MSKRAFIQYKPSRRCWLRGEISELLTRITHGILCLKGNRLLIAGKHPNKVKVACAREMVGFVWESLQKVAA
jgi:hypothetical protein